MKILSFDLSSLPNDSVSLYLDYDFEYHHNFNARITLKNIRPKTHLATVHTEIVIPIFVVSLLF